MVFIRRKYYLQFKAGLTRGMLDQLSVAEANFEIVAATTGMKRSAISVETLINMALRIEANKALKTFADGPAKDLGLKRESRAHMYVLWKVWAQHFRVQNQTKKTSHDQRSGQRKQK